MKSLRLAVPVRGQQFCEHFGRSDGFFLCEAKEDRSGVEQPRIVHRPKARCESLPDWLTELAVDVVLVGGIGSVGRRLLEEKGILVQTGHRGLDPAEIARAFLRGHQGDTNPCSEFEHRHLHCRKPRT